MKTLYEIAAAVLALAMVASGVADFRGAPQVLELMERLGYRRGFERLLGVIKLIGAVGLLVGLAITGIGVAAALGLCIYFALALRAHRSIGDPATQLIPAAVLLGLAALVAAAGLAV